MDPVTLLFIGLAALIALSKSSGVSGVIKGVSTVTKKVETAALFVKNQWPNAKAVEEQYGIPPFIPLLQAAYESDFATSNVYKMSHNLFGLNASQEWVRSGKPTYTNPVLQKQGQNFRVYPDDRACFLDWAEFIKTRYPLSFSAAKAGDLDMFLDGLGKGIYGAYAGPTDGSAIPKYKKEMLALLPSVQQYVTV